MTARSALGWAGRVVAWAVILAAIAALVVGVFIPRLGGATPYTVLSGSMRPTLPEGTLAVVRPVDPAQIRVGDVITYQLESGDPTVTTHRVVRLRVALNGEYQFRTQGDANTARDRGWVLPVQVKGRVWYAVPHLGRVSRLLTGQQRQWLEYAVAAGLLGYAAVMFGGATRSRWRARSTGSPVGPPVEPPVESPVEEAAR